MSENGMDFDPNDPKPKTKRLGTYDWATYVPYRNPEFKIHAIRGHALLGLSWHEKGILFRKIDNRWEEIWRVEDETRRNLMCGVEGCTNERKSKHGYMHSYMKWVHKDTDTPRLVPVCEGHYYDRTLK